MSKSKHILALVAAAASPVNKEGFMTWDPPEGWPMDAKVDQFAVAYM